MILNIMLVVLVLVTVAMVALILLQQGRGADAGAAFGGGSQSVFGARGSSNFLSRTTAVLATVFFLNSLGLAYINTQRAERVSVTEVVSEEPASVPSAGGDTEIPRVPVESDGESGDVPGAPSN